MSDLKVYNTFNEFISEKEHVEMMNNYILNLIERVQEFYNQYYYELKDSEKEYLIVFSNSLKYMYATNLEGMAKHMQKFHLNAKRLRGDDVDRLQDKNNQGDL